MGFKIDSKPTKTRDIVIFIVMLLGLAYVARDQLFYFIDDGGWFLTFDNEYDYYIIATSQVDPVGKALQVQCKNKNSCPEHPAGWNRTLDGQTSVRGEMIYEPVLPNANNQYQGFRLTYNYREGWQLVATGGLNSGLSMERIKLIQDNKGN
jgi:hypothetical protein